MGDWKVQDTPSWEGYTLKAGFDYHKVFAPVTRIKTIRYLLPLITQLEWPIYQMDVKSTFLNGVLKEDVYVEQQPRYMKYGKDNKNWGKYCMG